MFRKRPGARNEFTNIFSCFVSTYYEKFCVWECMSVHSVYDCSIKYVSLIYYTRSRGFKFSFCLVMFKWHRMLLVVYLLIYRTQIKVYFLVIIFSLFYNFSVEFVVVIFKLQLFINFFGIIAKSILIDVYWYAGSFFVYYPLVTAACLKLAREYIRILN